MSFAAITFCVASQRVFIITVAVYFVIDPVRKLFDTPSYNQIAYLRSSAVCEKYRVSWMFLGFLVASNSKTQR